MANKRETYGDALYYHTKQNNIEYIKTKSKKDKKTKILYMINYTLLMALFLAYSFYFLPRANDSHWAGYDIKTNIVLFKSEILFSLDLVKNVKKDDVVLKSKIFTVSYKIFDEKEEVVYFESEKSDILPIDKESKSLDYKFDISGIDIKKTKKVKSVAQIRFEDDGKVLKHSKTIDLPKS